MKEKATAKRAKKADKPTPETVSYLPMFSLKREPSDFEQIQIKGSETAANFIRKFYKDDFFIMESFFMVTLNAGNRATGFVKISQGGIVGTIVDIVIVAKYAVDSLAKGVIIAHNHPSGTPKPSENDIITTKKVKKGLALLDIKLVDSIILAEDRYFSFADSDLLD